MLQPDLSGKTALVTGASRGIGFAMALALASAGAHVIALARTVGGLEDLDDAISEAGGGASLIPCDITDAHAMDRLGPALASRFPAIDIVLANAGDLGELAPLADVSPKVWARAIDTNITGTWRLIRALDPFLRAAPAGRLIAVTSRRGREATPFWGAYAVAKAGLDMLIETYALETRSTAVRAALIDPGPMRTAMRAQAMPGEDPMTLPAPAALAPLVFHAASQDYDGIAERLIFKDWSANE